jgi:hypothetical protein
MSLLEMFCEIDDFWQSFRPAWQRKLLLSGTRRRERTTQLTVSEIMTIIILFHQSNYRTFMQFYLHHVCQHLNDAFPCLVSYNRFVELQSRGIAFIDAMSLAVCHNRRIHSHRVFEGIAARGKTSTGWFYGFKVHLVVNDQGELLAFLLTPGNVDDRKPVEKLTANLMGKLFGDKGYISKALFDQLFERGLQLVITLKRNMKPRVMPTMDRLFLRKRALIESVNDQLKNISQIEHSRHRSFKNFFVNLLAALIAYTHQPKKPSLKFQDQEMTLMTVV